MKSSSPDLCYGDSCGVVQGDNSTNEFVSPTVSLWRRRQSGSNPVAYASVLCGIDPVSLTDLAQLQVAASDEAGALLDSVEYLTRTLTSTVGTTSERCVSSVRGPIQWGETITARANALGNEDVYVCAAAGRTFNTTENRVLAVALAAIRSAGIALASPSGEFVDCETRSLVEARVAVARRWLSIPRMRSIPTGRLTTRELAQFRRSRRTSRMHAVIEFRRRQHQGFGDATIESLCDPWTTALHGYVDSTLKMLAAHVEVPESFQCAEEAISGGRVTFSHPALSGHSIAGLAVMGVPLLPPAQLLSGASWAGELPAKGTHVNSRADIERLLREMGIAHANTR